ncbi:hypothetical protein glysoja_035286 [Glycine soja]|uniref:Uncharacterized protein n=1 Tax=Glycine soja TaxID=3848 RepID=A0A0B2RJS2_GLYSO|nr:hypothetical protein glysoja_035286 [Glycine soja]
MIIMFREKMTVTILVKRCSTRRPLDCSNNIMLWLLHDDHKSFLLQTKSETHDVKEFLGSTDKGVNCWIKLNVDQAGFYRVKYDELLAARLRYAVEKQLLSASDRFGSLSSSRDPDLILEALLCCHLSQDAVCGLAVVTREGRDVAWSWL